MLLTRSWIQYSRPLVISPLISQRRLVHFWILLSCQYMLAQRPKLFLETSICENMDPGPALLGSYLSHLRDSPRRQGILPRCLAHIYTMLVIGRN